VGFPVSKPTRRLRKSYNKVLGRVQEDASTSGTMSGIEHLDDWPAPTLPRLSPSLPVERVILPRLKGSLWKQSPSCDAAGT
jgi:hypothetical protein